LAAGAPALQLQRVAKSIAIVGAGVSGLTCGVLFVERGHRTAIFAEQIGQQTTSGAAAALWFPYDCEPRDRVIAWALTTYRTLIDLCAEAGSGVSIIELRQYLRTGDLALPDWAIPLGASTVAAARCTAPFKAGFGMRVPLMDTTIYLDYLAGRFRFAGGEIHAGIRLADLENVDREFEIVINCAGIGARELVHDLDLEPHRGQVAIVPKIDNLSCAIVCDDEPLMYAIPRTHDCLLGGTNELSDSLAVDPKSTARIVAECTRVLNIEKPPMLSERVGLRPFRKSGVRLERTQLGDGRTVIHNYGHGGSGFTLSWGCAEEAYQFASR
jgi:D-amino-acid oxidase